MRMLIGSVLLISLGGTLAPAVGSEADACRVFVLKRVDQNYEIESFDLADNEMKVFPANQATGIVEVILSVGYGTSGSMAKWSDGRMIAARCKGGELQVTEKNAAGKDWVRPARRSSDLARFDVRVSVTSAGGSKQAFLILQNKDVVKETVGPIVDIFGGRIPMSEGDYTLCIDTYHHALGSHVQGEAPLEYDRWPLVTAKLPDGTEGVFIADIGAGTTVVSKKFLPLGTEIEKATMVQYSSAGKKMLRYAPGGATGAVDSVLGHANLKELRFGNIRFSDVNVDVMEEMPDIVGRPIAGILGMDLMRRCNVLTMSFRMDNGGAPSLSMGRSRMQSETEALELPFTFVNSHLIVDGRLNDSLVHFIMDTGCPGIIMDTGAAKRIGVKPVKKMRPGRGLDGGKAKFNLGSSVELVFGERSFGAVQPKISKLSCFTTLRTNGQNAGLLGNSFFSRFKQVEFDFERRIARFVK